MNKRYMHSRGSAKSSHLIPNNKRLSHKLGEARVHRVHRAASSARRTEMNTPSRIGGQVNVLCAATSSPAPCPAIHARSFTLSMRLLRNTNSSARNTGSCAVLRSPAPTASAPIAKIDRVCRHHDLSHPQRDHAPSQRRQHRRRRRRIDPARPDARRSPQSRSPAELAVANHLPAGIGSKTQRDPVRLPSRSSPRNDPEPHKAGRVGTCRCRQLVSPHVSSPRATPLRRATPEMLAPCSKLSATIRAFSAPSTGAAGAVP